MSEFRGKKVAITGGSSGIGLATAVKLARQGASVAILARNPGRLEEGRSAIEAAGAAKAIAVSVDVTDPAAVDAAMAKVIEELGGLDLLICNSGYARCETVASQPLDQFRALMDTNYFGHLHVVKAVLPHFKSQRSGAISLVTSMLGFMSIYGYGAYSASKYAIVGMGEALRQELKPFGVDVGIFYPPTTDTPGLAAENESKPAVTWAIEGTSTQFTSEQVADALLAGIRKRRFVNMVGFDSWFIYYATRWAPWLVHRITDGEMNKQIAKDGLPE
jgi:NAD(P)-dependent dehydrogenase (short-subunit alcohol dehydrogenase family)